MWAAVLEAAPGSRAVAPQHKALAEQLDRRGPGGVEVPHKSHHVPLPLPVIWRRGRLLQ